MGLINIPDETDLTTADANDLNSRFAIVTSLVNGNIDNANIKAGGVATSNLANQSVTSAKIADAGVIPEKLYNPYKFNAYASADSASLTSVVWTKAPINAEKFDTNNNFDTTLNRYVVPVSGFYQISGQIGVTIAGASSGVELAASLYKNGSGMVYSSSTAATGAANTIPRHVITGLFQFTAGDYLELYGRIFEGGRGIAGSTDGSLTFLTGFFVST